MVGKTTRYRVGDEPRTAVDREWEVFVRSDRDGAPLRSVGSVTAPTADAAHDVASRLFGWYATEVWLCPAAEVRRFSSHDLDDDATRATPGPEDEPRAVESE